MVLDVFHTAWASRLATAVCIAVAAWLVLRVVALVVARREHAAQGNSAALVGRRATLYRLTVNVTRYVLAFIAVTMILEEFHVNASSLLAAAGVVGLAVAFGAQQVVLDVVTGIFLLAEDQCRVGDSIGVPPLNLQGTVVEVGLRITQLRGSAGELIIVPNGLITEMVNYTRLSGTVSVAVAIPVAPQSGVAAVRQVLERVTGEMGRQFDPAELLGMTALSPGVQTWTISAVAPLSDQSRCSQVILETAAAALQDAGIRLAQGWGGEAVGS